MFQRLGVGSHNLELYLLIFRFMTPLIQQFDRYLNWKIWSFEMCFGAYIIIVPYRLLNKQGALKYLLMDLQASLSLVYRFAHGGSGEVSRVM